MSPIEGFDPCSAGYRSHLLLHKPAAQTKRRPRLAECADPGGDPEPGDGEGGYPPQPNPTFSNGAPLTAEDVALPYNSAAQGGGKIDMGNFILGQGALAYRGCHHLERPPEHLRQRAGVARDSVEAGITIAKLCPPSGRLPALTGW